jgi:hypothetical protein
MFFGRVIVIVVIALLFSNACGMDDAGVRRELRNESANSGLALAAARGNSIVIIPFDSEERYFQTDYTRQLKIFGTPGRMVVWLYRPNFLETSQFFIDFIGGQRVRSMKRFPGSQFVPEALNEATGRLAFSGRLQGKDSPEGLHWASSDLSHSSFIDQQNGYCDWAPDGSALTYEKKGQIFIFEIASNFSRRVTSGHDPTWSPNGESIAYRAPDGRASLVTTAGLPMSWPLSRHKPTSAIRWAPDGRYVSFTETIPDQHIPFISASDRLLVCRVRDGALITVQKFGLGPAGPMSFYWILQYRKFCADCKRGDPFN